MSTNTKRIAVVTGGGSGIGAEVALALAADDWIVALAGRRKGSLDEVVARGSDLTGKLEAIPTDVTDEVSVRELFRTVVDAHGRVDLLFNNAGIGAPAVDIDVLELDAWNQVVAVNLTGVFLCTREAFRVMRKQEPRGGRIINNGSISAHSPRPQSIAYTATKHAISGMTKSTSLDGRPFDIACGQIDVGNAATNMASSMAAGTTQADGSVRPEPLMDVGEVGRAVRYMASLPLDANIATLIVLPPKMPFIGRG
jgi:NAD(P)-dependent dehydrogenase (short-subunit alcohol dehydrogenase family)